MARASSEWDEYFGAQERGFFQGLLMFHRRHFIAPSTAHHFDRVFPGNGVFLEAGAGTSESSRKIARRDRVLMALDLSYLVLQRFNVLPVRIQSDIRCLPLHDESVSGIWNLGVMEHFTDQELAVVLGEFHRVLVPDGRLLLFWPPWYALHELVLNSVSWLARTFLRKTVVFFPDEVNLYRSRKRAAWLFERSGFRIEETSFGWRDLFSYVVVVASKMPSQLSEEAR
jgi:SAM-dependent methyltransferase